jgi:predicted kinase
VVVDASLGDPAWRTAMRAIALETSSDLISLRCAADVEVARERAMQRAERRVDASDATAEVADALATRFAPWPEATVLDTTDRDPKNVATDALAAVGHA